MSFLGQNNRLFWRVFLPSIILGVFILFRQPLRYGLTTLGYYIAEPIWAMRNFVLNDNTQSKSDDVKVLILRLNELEKINVALVSALNRKSNDRVHLAVVLSSLRSSPYDTFIIDQGSEDGIAFEQVVISESGVLLGEVIEVYSKISKVQLYSAFNKELEVVLSGGEHAIARGEGSQNFFLRLPRGLEISTSSTLFLPGMEAYVLANVEYVKDEPGDAFQKVYARSPVNINSLNRVYVSTH